MVAEIKFCLPIGKWWFLSYIKRENQGKCYDKYTEKYFSTIEF